MSKKVFLAHNACLNSGYDLNVLRSGIERGGSTIVDSPEEADEIVFSGCSVREHWVDDAINQVSEAHARAPNARIVVTGCVANTSSQKIKARLAGANPSVLTLQDVLSENTDLTFSEVDRNLSQGSNSRFESTTAQGLNNVRTRVGKAKSTLAAELEQEDRRYGSNLLKLYQQTTKGFVFYDEHDPCEMITVTRSCLYQCSFCNIPQGRGDYTSVPIEDVLAKARAAVASGRHHIVLIGDEVGNYGSGTTGPRFAELIQSVLDIDPAITLSIRYIEPKPFLKYFQDLLAWARAGKLQLLYISLQSGSPAVLKAMRRGYNIRTVVNALRLFRENAQTVLYGNWIVGFPGEDEEAFQATQALMKELDFHINVVIPFSARPDTLAYEMEHQIPTEIMTSRVDALSETAADMKVAMMHRHMLHLDPIRRDALLAMVRRAERDQYAPPSTHPSRLIPMVVQTL